MKKYYTALLATFLIFSCNQKEEDKFTVVKTIDTTIKKKEQAAFKGVNTQQGDTIRMLVEDAKNDYTAIGTIDSKHPRIYIKFINTTPGSLHAMVKPLEGEGNIRFSQILFPNRLADGPFDRDLFIKLKQTGEHTLIIGHSLMAENPYSGRFKVEIITR